MYNGTPHYSTYNGKARRFCLLILFVVIQFNMRAQHVLQQDTSFTVYSSYNKEVKKYPFIKIARPAMPVGVLSRTNMVYKTVNEHALTLNIYYPDKKIKKGYPVVLLIHGGGWRSGNKEQNIPMAQQISAYGYVCVTAQYRLSGEASYTATISDLQDAIQWIDAHADMYNINKDRIAVMGFSAGGQLAALLGVTNGLYQFSGVEKKNHKLKSIQAIVDVDGILAFKHPDSQEGAAAAIWLGGSYDENPSAWIEASPLTHVSRHTPPILFINSSLTRFHAGRDDMIYKLDSLHIYHEVHTLSDTPHPFWLFHPWFEPTLNFAVDFLDRVLKHT